MDNKDKALTQATPQQNLESSINSMQNVMYSIIKLGTPEQILSKLNTLQTTVKLNEVEKQIIKNVETSLDTSNKVDADYIREKFSYWFNLSPEREINKDKIDYAILDIQVRQAREQFAADLMKLASDSETLTSLDLKTRLNELTGQSILTTTTTQELINGIQIEEDAYSKLTENMGEFSLVIPELEKAAGKPAKGHIVSILAFVGSFKSTYSLQLAYENAKLGHNVLYLSLESTERDMVSRLVLNHIAETATKRHELISQEKVREAKLTKSEAKHYNNKHNEVVKEIGNNLILLDSLKINYNTFTEMTNVLRSADEKFKETTGKGLDMLVVDQLSLLKYTQASGKKTTYDGAVMNDWMVYFGNQALNFLGEGERQICYVNIAQTRREAFQEASKKKNKGRYDASAASDSHEIERTSDTIITLYKDLDIKNTLLMHVPKARHGSGLDEPIQVEVYGDYFHIGPMDQLDGEQITAESFEKTDFDLSSLLKM